MDKTVCHCIVKKNAEIIAKILDSDVDGKIADVVEVKHGKWVHLGGGEWACSECGNVIFTGGSWEKPYDRDFFCNKCGADMQKRRKSK